MSSRAGAHDVCVVGSGPTACVAAGDLAALGYDVVVAACARPARGRPIESITPLGLSLLDARGVRSDRGPEGAPASAARDLVVEAASTIEWPLPSAQSDARISLVRRPSLDAALRAWAERRGARFVESRQPWRVERSVSDDPLDASRTDGGVVTSRDAKTTLTARFLVAATGRTPILPSRRVRETPGLTAVAAFWPDGGTDGDARAIVRAHDDYWSWIASWPGVGVSAMAFVAPSDPRLRHRAWPRECLDALVRAGLGSSVPRADSVAVSEAGAYYDADPVGPGWLKAGDGALAVEPIASQGLQLALQSGAIAAACANTLLSRPGDLALVASFLADRHRAIAAGHRRLSVQSYADVAAVKSGARFWLDRGRTTADAAPAPRAIPAPLVTDRIVLNPSARATRIGACAGAEIVAVDGVLHDGLSTPLVYLGDVHVPPLLGRLEAQTRVADALECWSREIGADKATRVLAWLLRHDVVRAVPAG